MKKRILAVLLAALMLVSMTACSSILESGNAKKEEALVGYWKDGVARSEEENRAALENLDFYEEEIALCDLTATNYLYYYIRFNEDGTYESGIDAESTKTSMMVFLTEYCFPLMYEGRAELGDLYDVDLSGATQEEFEQFYAELYEKETFYDLAAYLAEVASEYEGETGTYRVDGNKLYFTSGGEEEYATFKLTKGTATEYSDLTVQYSDMTIYYRPVAE